MSSCGSKSAGEASLRPASERSSSMGVLAWAAGGWPPVRGASGWSVARRASDASDLEVADERSGGVVPAARLRRRRRTGRGPPWRCSTRCAPRRWSGPGDAGGSAGPAPRWGWRGSGFVDDDEGSVASAGSPVVVLDVGKVQADDVAGALGSSGSIRNRTRSPVRMVRNPSVTMSAYMKEWWAGVGVADDVGALAAAVPAAGRHAVDDVAEPLGAVSCRSSQLLRRIGSRPRCCIPAPGQALDEVCRARKGLS